MSICSLPMSPDQWLELHFGQEYFSGNFDHLQELIKKLNLAPSQSTVITIAGTNGKGETTRTLSELISQNHSVKTWTSPHLLSVVERFNINNNSIEPERLIELFDTMKISLSDELKSLSYFEFLFLSFLKWNQQQSVEFILLEVGLGGRLDACNAINTHCAVVTSISRDHQKLLGERYQDILREKLGICRDKTPLITCLELEYLRNKTREYIKNREIDWVDLFEAKYVGPEDHFSARNKKLAYFICQKMNIKFDEDVCQNYAMRMSLQQQNIKFDLYPSHNIDGLRKLVQFLAQHKYTNDYDLILVAFSKRDYRDLRIIGQILLSQFSCEQIKLVEFSHIKSIDNGMLKRVQEDFKFEILKEKKIFSHLPSNTKKVLVTGSNYFLGSFLQSRSSSS